MATVQIRYIVDNVDTAIAFYVKQLGFTLQMHPAPAFAMLTHGDLRLVLSAPNPAGGGGQPMPDGTAQQPGRMEPLRADGRGSRRDGRSTA
jgi:catechol 2,3-dioxygenase-like lactoylglutathione lyase family enzyme